MLRFKSLKRAPKSFKWLLTEWDTTQDTLKTGADRDGEETQDVVEITGEKSLSHGAGRGGRTPMTARVGGF